MVLTGNNNHLVAHLLTELNKHFRMKDLDKLHYFLGIRATFHEYGLFLCQQKYAEDLLAVLGMSECSLMPTPLPLQLEKVPGQDAPFFNPTYFRSLAGKLQYLTLTRPDIQFAVNFVCQKMHAPTNSDYNSLKRIIKYVKGTMDYGISFSKNTTFTLASFSDSDWAGCKETRRSTSSFAHSSGTT